MSDLIGILDDLALLLSRAEQSVKGRTFEDLIANEEAYDALTYRLAMIGETCKKLPEDLKERHPQATHKISLPACFITSMKTE